MSNRTDARTALLTALALALGLPTLAACGDDDDDPKQDGGMVVVDGGGGGGGDADGGGGGDSDGGGGGGPDGGDASMPRPDGGEPPPTTATCDVPTPLTANTPFMGSLANRAGAILPREPDCIVDEAFTYDGPDAVHSITLPAQSRMIVTLETDGTWDCAILIMQPTGCSENPVCLATRDRDFTGPEATFFDNNTDADLPLFVVAEGLFAAGGLQDPGSYTLTASIGGPAPGNNCTEPLLIQNAGEIRGSITNAVDNLAPDSTTCPGLDVSVGPYETWDVFYQLTLAVGQTLTASVTPIADEANEPFDLAIYVAPVSQCGAAMPTCFAGDDMFAADFTPESVTYTNNGSVAQDLLIGIESFTIEGDFNLNVTFD